jgi:hypothetical protein
LTFIRLLSLFFLRSFFSLSQLNSMNATAMRAADTSLASLLDGVVVARALARLEEVLCHEILAEVRGLGGTSVFT